MNRIRKMSVVLGSLLFGLAFVSCGAHEHTWGEGVETKEAGCTEDGILTFACTSCEETKTEPITALGHNPVDVLGYEPTCTLNGLTSGVKCDRCKYEVTPQETIRFLGHSYDGDVCTKCGDEKFTYGLVFELNDTSTAYSVVGYNGDNANVSIPANYQSLPVTEIAYEAFYDNYVIENVKIGSNVEIIEASAFEKCKNLETINIPNKVTIIKDNTFDGCSNLESVTIDGRLKGIGYRAFYNCGNLGYIDLGDYIETIGEEAFTLCYALTSIDLPYGLTYIGPSAFNWSGLYSVTIPSTVNTISEHAFFHCSALKTVTINEGVKKIEGYAFGSCVEIESINIPSSINNVEPYSFAYCDKLKYITVDENNTTYDSRNSCNAIVETETNKIVQGSQKTKFVDTITAVGEGAFFGSGVSSISLTYITKIGDSAFSNCDSLSFAYIPEGIKEIPDGCFAACDMLSEVNIAGSVEVIGDSAFSGCIYLKKLIIPTSVREIGQRAIYNVPVTSTVYYRGTNVQFFEIAGSDQVDFKNVKMVYAYQGD